MKLKKFNRKDCHTRGLSYPAISIEKSGIVRLNRYAAEHLSLNIGDKINLYQDEDKPKDWYIEKTTDDDGLIMRKHGDDGSLCCNASAISSKVKVALGMDKTMHIRIAGSPVEDGQGLFAILTGTIK